MSMYFILFSILTIICSLMIISSKNPIISVLYLIAVYILSSLLLLLLGAEFLAILIVIVYVGAISILFLFVIMMLNIRIVEVYNTLISYFPIGSFLGILFFFSFLSLLNNDFHFFSLMYKTNNNFRLELFTPDINVADSNLKLLGDILYNKYSYFLIWAALILLLAMLGSMVLTNDIHSNETEVKRVQLYTSTRFLKKHITFWSCKDLKKK